MCQLLKNSQLSLMLLVEIKDLTQTGEGEVYNVCTRGREDQT